MRLRLDKFLAQEGAAQINTPDTDAEGRSLYEWWANSMDAEVDDIGHEFR